MCDVVFITPNMIDSIAYESMGTMELATILNSNGIKCEIIPFVRIANIKNFDVFLENTIKVIEEKKPKIVSFYTRCDSYHISLRLAQIIKERFKDIYVVFGGPQADTTSEDTIRRIPYVDFVCCGEGEKTIYPFFSSLLSGQPDLTIPGLVYRVGDTVEKNPRPELIEDLNSLPMIDFSLAKYNDLTHEKIFAIEVGRGCPFGCVFCSTNSFWGRRFRLKSPERIFNEIKKIHEITGITKFHFMHDMFTFKKSNVIEICKLLKTLDFPIQWVCSARLDCLDYEVIDAMIDAGMYSIYFGVETGSPRMQKLVNKNLNIENAVEIIGYLNSKNINIITSFIYGFPEETEEDFCQTLSLISNLMNFENVDVQTHLCAFLPKTPLTQKYKDYLTPTQHFSNFTGEVAIDECRDIIENNPELFDQVMEYRTELREKLEHFGTFIKVWRIMSPVYNYISQKYPQDRMIDMYFDFMEANSEVLDKCNFLEKAKSAKEVIKNDKFILRYADDENYDAILDYYRMYAMSSANNGSDYSTGVLCFDPNGIKEYSSIADFPKGSYVVVCKRGKFAAFPKK